jgi:hypothetical protein
MDKTGQHEVDRLQIAKKIIHNRDTLLQIIFTYPPRGSERNKRESFKVKF